MIGHQSASIKIIHHHRQHLGFRVLPSSPRITHTHPYPCSGRRQHTNQLGTPLKGRNVLLKCVVCVCAIERHPWLHDSRVFALLASALLPRQPLFAVSGVVPTEPVVNSKSGQLYERRLIEKVIDVEGKDPVTGEETTVADLIAVKSKRLQHLLVLSLLLLLLYHA